jgi:alpha-N-arabinofuranosidase
MIRHTDAIAMSAFTMGVSTLDYNRTSAILNSTGLLFKLYGDHFVGSIPVAVNGNSPQPAPKYDLAGDQPATNPGSPTYPLDMVASLTPDRKFLTLAVVNATETEQKFDLNVEGVHVAGPSTLWQMTGSSLDAANHVGAPPQVVVKEIAREKSSSTITVAPASINIYKFQLEPHRFQLEP